MIQLPQSVINRLIMNCGARRALEAEDFNPSYSIAPIALVTAPELAVQYGSPDEGCTDEPDTVSPQWLLIDMDPETGRVTVLASLGLDYVELGYIFISEIEDLGQEVITDLPDFNLLTYWRAAQDMPDKRITLDPDKLRAAAQALAREALEAADD